MRSDPETDASLLRAGAHRIAAKLRARGFEAYFAGGCVRDLLRGEAPKDFDVVTNARPEEVRGIFRRTVEVGAAFGVVRVLIDARAYEVATYRKDLRYSDGRHPDRIEYSTSKEEDVERRDFTINALLLDPDTGEIFDRVGGREDIERRVIRAVGDPHERFAEDRLRMLRAVRFAARFGYEIEPKTMDAIRQHAGAIGAVSIERIVMELEGIFLSADPARGFELLISTGLLAGVLPFLSDASPPALDGLRERLERLPPIAAALDDERRVAVAWALAFDSVHREDASDRADERREIEDRLRGFKLSRNQMRRVLGVIDARRVLIDPERYARAARVRIAIDPEVDAHLAFVRARLGSDALAARVWASEIEALANDPLPQRPLVTGEDLKILGLEPGPGFKAILSALEDEIFERRIKTRKEALAWVRLRYFSSVDT